MGHANLVGEGSKWGLLAFLEPGFRVTDNFMLGFRTETALMRLDDLNDNRTVSFNTSLSAFLQLDLSKGKVRPFIGGGYGFYYHITISGSGDTEAWADGLKFGAYPRIGFDIGAFNFSIDYNIMPRTKNEPVYSSQNADLIPKYANSNYLGVKLGATLIGGRKK